MPYILMILLPLWVMAEDINVLYERVTQSDLYKSSSQSLNATVEAKKASLYSDGWNIGADIGQSEGREGADSGMEFGLSLSKDFNLNAAAIEHLINTTQAYAEHKKKIEENRLKVKLWQRYGNYCITLQAIEAKGELGVVYDTIRDYIDKGVEYGEFDVSKSIMALLALENLNLQISKLENSAQHYEAGIRAIVPFDGQFVCQQLRPDITRLFDSQYSAFTPVLQKQIEINKETLALASKKLSTINIGTSYTNELDADKYMFNVSIPLALGNKQQASRASALHALQASNYELEGFKNRYAHESAAIESRLRIYNKYLNTSDRLIRESSNKLIEQSNMRFRAGEESLIAMLKATETKLQMIETILELKIDRHNAVAQYMYDYAIDPKGVSK